MNKKLLVIAATHKELAPTFDHFGFQHELFVQHPQFDILISGVGMTATAFALGKHLNSNYYLVLNVGIAGSFDQKIALGSLVNITEDVFAELGAENGDDFISIDELGFGKSTYFSNNSTVNLMVDDLPKVKGITVNKVHGNAKNITAILKRSAAQTESMEGAAVFYASAHANIPAIQIRSISNYVKPRNKNNWKINLAIQNLNNWLIAYLNKH